jgi:type IV pilus assembly protein PilV
MKSPGRQRGVGMVEVLVALVVLAIGLMGLAALMVRTMRNNSSALERGMALVETYAIADAMRADRINALAGNYNIAIGTDPASGTTFAARALTNWRTNLKDLLGAQATGSVACVNNVNGSTCTITVRWDDTLGSGGAAQYSVMTEVRL